MNDQELNYIATNVDIQITLRSILSKLTKTYKNLSYITPDDIEQDLLLIAIKAIPAYKDRFCVDSIEHPNFNGYLNHSLKNYWINEIKRTEKVTTENQSEVITQPRFTPPELTDKELGIYCSILEAKNFIDNPDYYIKDRSGKLNYSRTSELLGISRKTIERAFKS